MSLNKAVLRDVDGEHMGNLSPEEVERYEFLAAQGSVLRLQKMKKGRPVVIFRLKKQPVPVEPSSSKLSDSMLTVEDSWGLAGLRGEPTRRDVERWIGWGLIAGRTRVRTRVACEVQQ